MEIDKRGYKAACKRAKKEVARAKESAWKLWSEDLHTAAGQQKMFKMAQQMRRDKKDIIGSNFIRDGSGNIRVD